MTVPEKVYAGNSCSVSVTLGRRSTTNGVNTGDTVIRPTTGESGQTIDVEIQTGPEARELLEIELIGAGVEISGDSLQSQDLNLESLHYHWSCYFPTNGSRVLTLVMRLASGTDVKGLGSVDYHVNVVRLGRMTRRQVWALGGVTGTVGFASGVAEIVNVLGFSLAL